MKCSDRYWHDSDDGIYEYYLKTIEYGYTTPCTLPVGFFAPCSRLPDCARCTSSPTCSMWWCAGDGQYYTSDWHLSPHLIYTVWVVCLAIHWSRWLYICNSICKKGALGGKSQFWVCIWSECALLPFYNALYCTSVADSVSEIYMHKVWNYKKCLVEKTTFKYLLTVKP